MLVTTSSLFCLRCQGQRGFWLSQDELVLHTTPDEYICNLQYLQVAPEAFIVFTTCYCVYL